MALYALTLSQAYMPHISYWMNREFIAAELCENRDRPELHCEGKCQLKKEIQETADDQPTEREVSVRLMVEFLQPLAAFTLNWKPMVIKFHFPSLSDRPVKGFDSSIFRPPEGRFFPVEHFFQYWNGSALP
jgi:hypothetical protein